MSEVYLVERNHYGQQIGSGEVYTDKATAQSFADAANEYLKIAYTDYSDDIANHVVTVPTVEGVKEYEVILTAEVTHSSPVLTGLFDGNEEYYLTTPGYRIVEKGTPVPELTVFEPGSDELNWPYWAVKLHAHTMDEMTELAQPYLNKFNATL
jgi:hypothetical protein